MGVKKLALGVLMSGMIAAPSLGGAIRHGSHPSPRPNGELHGPAIATENLATTGGYAASGSFGFGNSGYGPAYGYGYGYGQAPATTGNSLGTTTSIWGSTSSNQAPPAAPFTPSPIETPAPAYTAPAPTYTAPVVNNSSAGTGLGFGGFQGGGGHTVDAFVNFGTSGFSEAASLTTGNPTAWYNSPAVQQVYGGTPDAAHQAGFIAEVLQTVQHAYAASGLNISLTADPAKNYAHTLSVVSGASYSGSPDAIGITDVGNDGFSFIDKFGQAKNADQLAIAVGNNIAHELMHAFGLASHPDQTGAHIDAATASWSTLTDPNATFSGQAAQILGGLNFLNGPGKEFTQGNLSETGLELLAEHHTTFCNCPYCAALRKLKAAEALASHKVVTGEETVPEPTTVALWGLAGGLALACHRRRNRA